MSLKISQGKQIEGATVFEGNPTQLRKIQCPGCQQVAQVTRDANNKPICYCGSCGRTFKSIPM